MTGDGRVEVRPSDPGGVAAAAREVAAGGLAIHATETVVSLSGDPAVERAVAFARRLKGYTEPRPFLVLVPDVEAARSLAGAWPAAAEELAGSFWPGPLTLVAAAGPRAPGPVVSEGGTVALRPASDPVSLALLAALERPLFSTSANRRGDPPPKTVREAIASLGLRPGGTSAGRRGRDVVALLEPEGASPSGAPSSVVDVSVDPPRVVRTGAIAVERLRRVRPDLRV